MADKSRKDRLADDAIFREVDEELRQDRTRQLWEKYGGYALGAAVALVLGVAGYQGWTAYDKSVREDQGDRYAVADRLAGAGEYEAAARAFADLAADAGAGYATLARLRQAAAMVAAGDRAGALSVWDALAADDGVEPVYRDLADLMWALHSVDEGAPEEVAARLEPLIAPDGAWRFTAMETMAVLRLRTGESQAARDLFTRIVDDDQAPPDARSRAREMLDALGEAASS